MKKKIEKWIVNGLTTSRIVGMVLLPVLFNALSAPIFLLVVASLLFTDFLDGFLARKFKVSTIGGSLLDMGADKLFGMSILVVLGTMYPVMFIPLLLEGIIMGVNVMGVSKGSVGKSSEIGRIKTWIMGLSMCSLLLVGLSPELSKSISNLNFRDLFNFVNNNKELIKDVSVTATIVSESIVLTDYSLKSFKNTKTRTNIDELKKMKKELLKKLKDKDFYDKVLFDEKYNEVTKDLVLKDKLLPNKEEEEKIKKLVLNYKNSIDN